MYPFFSYVNVFFGVGVVQEKESRYIVREREGRKTQDRNRQRGKKGQKNGKHEDGDERKDENKDGHSQMQIRC